MSLCKERGIDLLITSTYRDAESQDAIYAIGRTIDLERHPVTNAKGWQSWHQFKVAWDVVPLIGGKCNWQSRFPNRKLTPVWAEVVELGKQAGALAGADWTIGLTDDAHFQVRPKLGANLISLADAQTRFKAMGTIFL